MNAKLTARDAYLTGKLRLPLSYHIGCDAEEALRLHRHDGSVVAVFGRTRSTGGGGEDRRSRLQNTRQEHRPYSGLR